MTDDLCLDVSKSQGPVKMLKCHGLGGNQKWEYDKQVHALIYLLSPLTAHILPPCTSVDFGCLHHFVTSVGFSQAVTSFTESEFHSSDSEGSGTLNWIWNETLIAPPPS